MSKVGNKTNKLFNPIITDISYDSLIELRSNGQLMIPNAFIISIPQNNGEDIEGAASIWMTDEEGKLLNITKPINE